MAYSEIGVTIIQEITGESATVASPPLPLVLIGPGYNIQTLSIHDIPESYVGLAKSVGYPGIQPNEFVDVGNQDTWGDNENVYPLRVYVADGKKLIASSATGYFSSQNHAVGSTQTASVTINGFSLQTFRQSNVGKIVWIHTGSNQGPRTILTVSADGSSITVSGAAFSATESVNTSVLPSNGQVSRFYSEGNLSSVRIGDLIEIAPAYTTVHEVVSVDQAGNYVDLKTLVTPTGNTVSWRATALFELVNVTNTLQSRIVELQNQVHYSYDGTIINISGGISDPTSPSGPIISGTIKASYRALKSSLSSNTGEIKEDSDIASNVGTSASVNTLAFALTKARENTTFSVRHAGMDVIQDVKDNVVPFDGPSKLATGDVLERLLDEDSYVKVMLSQYAAHNVALNLHIDEAEDPSGIYNNVSVGIINTGLIRETVLAVEVEQSAWDVEGLIEASAVSDGQLYTKTGRLYSRGVKSSPNFDGAIQPLPVNVLTDLVKLDGGSIAGNNGFWKPSLSETLSVRDPGLNAEIAPQWGYWAAYGNRIRSGAFGLTASDALSMVRLTGPAGLFRYIESGLPALARAYLPVAQDGVICNVTAVSPDFSYIDTNIPWDAAYAGSSLSQVSIIGDDGVFATPGLITSLYTKSDTAASLDSGANTVTAGAVGFFAGMENLWLKLSTTTGDDGYHKIISLDITNTIATVAAIANTEAGKTVEMELVQVNGVSGKAEFAGSSISTGNKIRTSSREQLFSGVSKVNGTKDITAGAGVWGPDDVGKLFRVVDSVTDAVDYLTVDTFNQDGSVTTDRSVNFASANAVSVQMSDSDHLSDIDVNILEVDASNEYVRVNKNWSQFWISNGTTSMDITGLESLGFGDAKRTVRVLNGPYAGQTYTVFAVREEELILSIGTSFGSIPAPGLPSSGGDLSGFSIEFVNAPGNNTILFDTKLSEFPSNESGKLASIQRDFREIDITGETFVAKGIVPGDILRVATPASIADDYVILNTLSQTRLRLAKGSELPLSALPAIFDGSTEPIKYELVRPKTKAQQAEAVRDYASAFGSRRLVLLWPDVVEIDISNVTSPVPGYIASAMVGALASGLAPQQPLSKIALTGIKSLVHSKIDGWFTRVNLNTMASGGVMIIHMDSDEDIAHIRHQLTTDMSSVKTQEFSITKIIDYISIVIKQEFGVLTGIYNITPELLTKLRSKGQAITQFFENQNDSRAGRLVNDFEFALIEQSPDSIDEVVSEADVDAPVPFNRLRVRVRA